MIGYSTYRNVFGYLSMFSSSPCPFTILPVTHAKNWSQCSKSGLTSRELSRTEHGFLFSVPNFFPFFWYHSCPHHNHLLPGQPQQVLKWSSCFPHESWVFTFHLVAKGLFWTYKVDLSSHHLLKTFYIIPIIMSMKSNSIPYVVYIISLPSVSPYSILPSLMNLQPKLSSSYVSMIRSNKRHTVGCVHWLSLCGIPSLSLHIYMAALFLSFRF